MGDHLTEQDKTFVKEVVKHGNKTKAAKKAYGIKNEAYARVKGHKQLTKNNIVKEVQRIADQLPDDLLVQKHKELMEQKRVEYFVFPKSMEDEEIIAHVEANGIEVIVVREGEKGKYAFYSTPDANAIKAGIDMGYKLKGAYAPDKSINVNMDIDVRDPRAKELAEEYEKKLKESL